jgi:hypothetical protein
MKDKVTAVLPSLHPSSFRLHPFFLKPGGKAARNVLELIQLSGASGLERLALYAFYGLRKAFLIYGRIF